MEKDTLEPELKPDELNEETKTQMPNMISSMEEVQNLAQQSIRTIESLKISNVATNENVNKYLPGPLQSKGIQFTTDESKPNGPREDTIQKCFERLILCFESEDSSEMDRSCGLILSQLDDVSEAAIVSHSLAAYISTLETRQLRKLATRISSDTGLWICRLLRFFDSLSYFHEDNREGLLRVCRMALNLKYPRYANQGFEALFARPPVIYLSAAAKPNMGQYICTQLGLPLSTLNIVPCNTVFGNSYKMDIAALESLIQEDLAAARMPLLLVAHAGAPVTGQVDGLPRLMEICKVNDIWLHVEGLLLAGLCLEVSVPNLPARIGDSMTLSFGSWLGVPALPFVTLFKAVDSASVHISGLSSLNLQVRLNCLPMWTVLQCLGHDGVVNRIKHCFELSERLMIRLQQTPRISIVGKGMGKIREGQAGSLSDVMSKAVSTSVLFDILVPVVLFQYVPDRNEGEKVPSSENETIEAETNGGRKSLKNPPYFDNLNSWLGQILMRDIVKVKLDIVELDQHGFSICFSPLESAHAMKTSLEDIDDLCICLEQQQSILNATVKQKDVFQDLVSNHKNLQVVEIGSWAGLGAVRYIPSMLVGRLNELTDSGKEEINRLNSELVAKLKSTDSAFSLGEGDDGMLGVRFGMVTEDLDMEELLGMVLSHGQQVEESSKFLESMSEMVRLGIEEANKELLKENEDKIMQEGILRQVPLVSTFFNWWSPVSKDNIVKGRCFNLSSGVVETTENIYKYHMQIQQDSIAKKKGVETKELEQQDASS